MPTRARQRSYLLKKRVSSCGLVLSNLGAPRSLVAGIYTVAICGSSGIESASEDDRVDDVVIDGGSGVNQSPSESTKFIGTSNDVKVARERERDG